jgi:hypothetical protein
MDCGEIASNKCPSIVIDHYTVTAWAGKSAMLLIVSLLLLGSLCQCAAALIKEQQPQQPQQSQQPQTRAPPNSAAASVRLHFKLFADFRRSTFYAQVISRLQESCKELLPYEAEHLPSLLDHCLQESDYYKHFSISFRMDCEKPWFYCVGSHCAVKFSMFDERMNFMEITVRVLDEDRPVEALVWECDRTTRNAAMYEIKRKAPPVPVDGNENEAKGGGNGSSTWLDA